MAIRDERTASIELLRDARFHRAALKSDATSLGLAGGLEATAGNLKAKLAASDAADDKATDALAVVHRTDFELDEALRRLELEVLGAVGKIRTSPGYRAVFPNGLSALVALRGDPEAREVEAVVLVQLEAHFAELAAEHGKKLLALAKTAREADVLWRDSAAVAARMAGDEVIARIDLVRQLQKNEGALLSLYPGQRRRVRSYFRPTHRRGAVADDGAPEAACS